MKFALLLVAALASPTSAVFIREAASDDSSVTDAPCPESCPFKYEPVCATFDHRYSYYWFTNYCVYLRCLCRLNYRFPLVPFSHCFFKASNARNTCPARGKLRQMVSDDDDLSYSRPQNETNAQSAAQGGASSWEQSGEVFG